MLGAFLDCLELGPGGLVWGYSDVECESLMRVVVGFVDCSKRGTNYLVARTSKVGQGSI